MSAYRNSADMPLAIVEPVKLPPRGLVRANGSACRCRPPGILYCWWFEVKSGDQWFCKHGGGWERRREGSNLFFEHYWTVKKT